MNSEKAVHIVLLAGQSNMAGVGNYDELEVAIKNRIEKVAERVSLSIDGKTPIPLSFVFSQHQKDKRGFGNVFGPELFLALTLAEENPTQEYLFVKTAQGGTALYGAWNPEWTAEKAIIAEAKGFKRNLKLYSLHQSHIKQNLQTLTDAGKAYKIIGMCWMQGENDAAKEVSARSYGENLAKLIKGYRKEFNLPNMPFVLGQINSTYGRFPEGPEMVRKAMVKVADADPKVSCIKTSTDTSWSDYPKHSDNVHYNTEGQSRLGRAFGQAILNLNETKTAKQRFSTAGFYAVDDSPRSVWNFNPGWRFYKGDVDGAECVSFDDRNWEAANLPHGLEILGENGSGGRNYQGKAWYRKQFEIQNQDDGERTFLYFEAIMGKCKIWVNGNLLAEHFGGYLPIEVDITDVINPKGESNIVAVLADNIDDKTYLPGKNQSGLDFAYFGGIYRDTYLIQTSSVHFTFPELSKTVAGAGVFVATLDVNGKDAKMEVRTELSNESKKAVYATVKIILENEEFQSVKEISQKVKLEAGSKQQLSNKFVAENVHLWHPDDPYLHFVRTEIIINGKIVDQMRTRIGIRLFEMRGAEGLFINKKFYDQKLIGANRHQDYSYIGNALPNSGQWRDVKLLREGGCRIIRAAHYPQDPAFYDACDELGMLTTTANPGWHFFNFKNPIFEERLYNDTRELVRRDRNVASILMWETALNETPSQPDHAMHNMHQIAHEEYPFPGMFTVTDHQEAKKGGLDMYYHGDDKNVNSFNREYGDGWEVDNWQSQNAMSRVKMEWGEKAMLTQALRQAKELNDRYPTPKVRLGGAKWAGIDHQRGYHPDPFWGGLLNGVRLPKYVYYVYKSQYDVDYKVNGIETGPMLFNTNELTQVSPKDVVIFSNCDEIRLYWLGELVATQKPSSEKAYADMPHPPFVFENVFDFEVIKSTWRRKTKEVEMITEGLINGKVVIRDVKNYPEQSAGLKLSIADEGMNLMADGSDIIPFRATIVDPDGMKKVLASEYVYFEVDGPAEIIGGKFNMGNPVKTEMGIATVLVRATTKAGSIKLRAYSNGLKSDSLTIESELSGLKLLFNNEYQKASIKTNSEQTVIIQKDRSDMPMDIIELQKEIKLLRLEKVGKEQEIMELRSQLKGK